MPCNLDILQEMEGWSENELSIWLGRNYYKILKWGNCNREKWTDFLQKLEQRHGTLLESWSDSVSKNQKSASKRYAEWKSQAQSE